MRISRSVLLLFLATACLIGGLASAEDDYPVAGLLPKAETGATRFLEAHPEWDGRGVVVAIFDTGVDPGAPGMQTTTDGKPKVIDIVDGSGSGDVDTSETRKLEDGKLNGLSGRTLTPDPKWKNPSGKWHVGLKRAFELFPGGLVARLEKKRKEKFFERHRALQTRLERRRAALEDTEGDEAKRERVDLKRQLDALAAWAGDYKDPGPVVDCVVFHDGTHWRAVVDADEDGDLAEHKALTNYRVERQYETFGKEDLLNYGVNIYDEGKLLSIVVDSGAHGTHVAGIVAAHHPDQPARNGLAPGAQIVSVKIGDSRLGSGSTGTGDERGVVAVLRNKCDLVNMSYGGASRAVGNDWQARLLTELVDVHNVIFVSSAGNDGPCLSTVGSPGGTTSALLGIGAHVSKSMMEAQMAVRDDVPPTHFTWSSRGPTIDGDMGVDFSAPGGAIAPVPTWSLQGTMQMNGTSMAAPNACGSIALMLSGMKAERITITPQRVRRALSQTASDLDRVSPFGEGRGMIQIDKAYAYIEQHAARTDEDVQIEVRLRRRGDARGLYLREPHEVDRPRMERIYLRPRFHEDTDNRKKVDYELPLRLESTQGWIRTPENVLLTHGGERFEIRVDPTGLVPGVHFGEVLCFDTRAAERGALVRVPVTVIKPHPLTGEAQANFQATLKFEPGTIHRHFFAVPQGATWMDLRLRAADGQSDKVMVIQAVQLLPGRSFKDAFFEKYLRLHAGELEGYALDVTGGALLELDIAQYWSSLEPGTCNLEVEFHGIVPEDTRLLLDGNDPVSRVDVRAPLRTEELSPRASLDKVRRSIRPDEATIRPLDPVRDGLPKDRLIHEAVLTYSFDVAEDWSEVQILSGLAAEDVAWDLLSGLIWQLFDENKRLVKSEGLGGEIDALPEGSYTLRMLLRHRDPKVLERMRNTVVHIDRALGSSASLGVHATAEDALLGGDSLDPVVLYRGARQALYLRHLAPDDLPDGAEPGDLLTGRISFGARDSVEAGSGKRPGGFPVRYRVPPGPTVEDDDEKETPTEDEESSKDEALEGAEEALLDAGIEQLAALRDAGKRKAFWELHRRLTRGHPDELRLRLERLRMVLGDGPPYDEDSVARIGRVLAAAQHVTDAIDTEALAKSLGTRNEDKDGDDQPDADPEIAQQKSALLEALHARCQALFARGDAGGEAFEKAWTALGRFTDVLESPYSVLAAKRAVRRNRPGRALEIWNGRVSSEPLEKSHREARLELIESLGWDLWAAYEESWLLIRFPPTGFPPF